MATRTRTALFLQYRNTFQQTKPRLGSNSMDNNERATLLNSNEPINDTVLELTNLPPKWVDIMDEIEEDFSAIKSNSTYFSIQISYFF